MATPQEISYITTNCLMELRPRIKDIPKHLAIPIIDAACLRYRLPYNHIAPILGFELREEITVVEKKIIKSTPKPIIHNTPKKEILAENTIEKKKEIQKVTFSQKPKTKKPSIKELFADNGERKKI